jgi:hypothetical protein
VNKPILRAVRAALYGTAITTAPALLATGFGVGVGHVAEPIARCQHGEEVAVCGRHSADEPELHRHPLTASGDVTVALTGQEAKFTAGTLAPGVIA